MITLQIVFGFTVAVLMASMADSMVQELMNPATPGACVADDLNITCNYTGNQPKPRLVFKSDPERSHWTQTDEIVATFHLSNISAYDNYVNIFCCVESCVPFAPFRQPAILRVYSQPIPLQNFSCEVYNYHEHMSCTWYLGQKYLSTPPGIECNFRLPNNSGSWTNCNQRIIWKFQDNFITVVLRSTADGDFSMKQVDFKMTVVSQCGKNVSEVYQVHTKNIVRPAPAKDLSTVVINSTCIELGYTQTVYLNYSLKYTLTVSSRWNDTKVFTGVSKQAINKQLVCYLHPYTEYTMTVQLQPEHGGLFSSPGTISSITLQSVPSSGPLLIRGGYLWNPQDCIRGRHRDLTVYWQEIPDSHKNGDIIYFTASLTPLNGGDVLTESDVASKVRQKSFLGQRVRCDTAYTVTVAAYTNIGSSPVNYTIQVSKFSTDLPQPEFWTGIVNQTNVVNETQMVAIHWPQVSSEVKQKLQVQSFTVCYCRKSIGNCQNDVPVRCSSANVSENSVNLTVSFPEDYLYGVSMTTPLGDSGLMWQSCLYLENAEPTKAPLNVNARTGSGDNTIIVLWSPLPCESGQPYIESYTIQYCPVEKSDIPCSGLCNELSVIGTASSHNIKELIEDQTYCFTVMGVTTDGSQGPASKPAFAVARNNDLKPGTIAGIVIGGLFMLIINGSVIFLVFRNCQQRMTLWKRKKMDITITEMKTTGNFNTIFVISGEKSEEYVSSNSDVEEYESNNKNMRDLERQVSKDSGVEDPASTPPHDQGFCNNAKQELKIVHEGAEFQRETGIIGHNATTTQSWSSGVTDLKQPALKSDHFVNPSSAHIGSYAPVPTLESTDDCDSGGLQKRNIHNLKLHVDGGSIFHQASDPSIPFADYVFAINEETTPHITSESPHLVKLQTVPIPIAFKTQADKRPDSLIQENDALNSVLESSTTASKLSLCHFSNTEPVESYYMKADVGLTEVSSLADGCVTFGTDVKQEDTQPNNMSNQIINKPGLTNYVSTDRHDNDSRPYVVAGHIPLTKV
ncbi:uncharacterized protein LOC127867102 [Dreissena polymorpha]|uniref:Fibronectin type-III domain-containing protein n=1 Tax=Dreissena polymorpha TaxID=45954 RepID=A0A9D4N486_DREPO|nr:uncharacterized protein LOC127867102 [Dreissena polymorpha]KAH3889357.1 hypothetical protein DPMN_013411 [Dreissena polymorpha]